MPPLDHDRCYAAASSRDARFDGWFVTAVRTTGIYCRPSCPAMTPKRSNVEFHHTAAAAQQRGFRACKRCRPDATPGSPDWNVRQDLVARAMRLIADGVVEREGVGGLARRLGYSERHLNRLLTDEVGAGPLALARAQRAQTARLLIETTDVRLTDVAFAAGFGSVRQFNDTIRAVFDATPSALRGATRVTTPGDDGSPAAGSIVRVRLPTRAPFDPEDTLGFVAQRCVPGLESFVDGVYRRVLDLPGGHALVSVHAAADPTGEPPHLEATFELAHWSDLGTAVQRTRRLFDLDADPVAVAAHLASGPLAVAVARRAGVRSPASVDPFETAVRAVIGQQISVSGASTVTARLVAALGEPLAVPSSCARGPAADEPGAHDGPSRAFPRPEVLADAPDDALAMPQRRRDTVRRLAAAVASGELTLDVGTDRAETRDGLLAIRGIGPWTADYVMMRALGDPDVALRGDLVAEQSLADLGIGDAGAFFDACAPWRSYAVHHLWRLAGDRRDSPAARTSPGAPTPSQPHPDQRSEP